MSLCPYIAVENTTEQLARFRAAVTRYHWLKITRWGKAIQVDARQEYCIYLLSDSSKNRERFEQAINAIVKLLN